MDTGTLVVRVESIVFPLLVAVNVLARVLDASFEELLAELEIGT